MAALTAHNLKQKLNEEEEKVIEFSKTEKSARSKVHTCAGPTTKEILIRKYRLTVKPLYTQ